MIYRKISSFLLFSPNPSGSHPKPYQGNPPFISFLLFSSLSRFIFTAGVLKYWIWRSVLGFCVDYVKCSFFFLYYLAGGLSTCLIRYPCIIFVISSCMERNHNAMPELH
ncbi:hypothetical protein ASPBRDRAFT_455844 [Aspergillus brasiliensis CBS 101740]|uniref:Uncharacterized protein n=1 Tax=Aspergillus brasiliensis (strain CBS 101740 / IMI 381727 / IBT 21946) TaxID=767769 RepID=A0A1L9USM3_ASPBC|nr:hypothetical protein ASPBRDRAFT_455844 [Aspergillus brasiliensis CBS 101740]